MGLSEDHMKQNSTQLNLFSITYHSGQYKLNSCGLRRGIFLLNLWAILSIIRTEKFKLFYKARI